MNVMNYMEILTATKKYLHMHKFGNPVYNLYTYMLYTGPLSAAQYRNIFFKQFSLERLW